ncbi:ubiquitin carboxyl-terminal hydrolase 28 isoform X5 [Latimeria chalumnae]|uniref:ubiquitin carboxyl-terminal hydrolase 28 isoform X5 n=1 Tax=Latimeria chalumnae TaxID=7897 RepID=UPI00313C2D88
MCQRCTPTAVPAKMAGRSFSIASCGGSTFCSDASPPEYCQPSRRSTFLIKAFIWKSSILYFHYNSVLINQLREITGTQNIQLLQEALKASNGDITQAVSLLTDEHAKEPDQEVLAVEPSDSEGSAVDRRERTNVIDLTRDDKDDLQTAIALSLRESQKAQTEERDLNRTLEANTVESNPRTKRKRCEVWGENTNPSDWRRVDNWPVGLRNVGNTCWFSAVIQSLFHLPEFRRLVISYALPQSILESCRSHSEKRNIAFMQELRTLFALMIGSNHKFVDPSAALELLKDAFRSTEAQQQDVSEFTHKLLDWLEDAFQIAANVNNSQKLENPMVQLFYGTFLAEGIHDGKTFSNVETFGQYPLQVNGYNNLNECLEGAMVDGEIESLHSDQSIRSGQEHWFAKLPPVLTFELSRFEFNQSLGRPEKIHKKLEFPELIYLDRYLHKNKELIQAKREEVKKLKEQMTVLHQKLERYMSYGSGPSHFPLADMLQYVLEFASTKPSCVPPTQDVQMSSPSCTPESTSQSVTQASVSDSDTSESPESVAASPVSPPSQRTPVHKPFTQSRPPVEMPTHPAPRFITEEEFRFIESCLQRWRSEVEHDVQDLKNRISKITQSIEQMYSESALCQVPYRLHAVLVHEGQANAGHYWAYIYDHTRRMWLKYNDIAVTESSWEELERDSYGGLKNASAYCLMYINNKLPHLIAEDVDEETGQVFCVMDALPSELKHWVWDDNLRFEHELEEWEDEQSRKIPQKDLPASLGAQDSSPAVTEAPLSPSQQVERSLAAEHAVIAKEQTAQAIAKTANSYEKNGVEAALNEAFHEEFSRLYLLAKEVPTPHNDPRLQHVLVYFFQNEAPKRVIERTLLEQFADRNLSYDERSISIMKVARAKLRLIGPEDMDMEEYRKWHEDYSLFRKVSVYLLTGLEQYQNGKCREALTYLVYAYQNNTTLLMKGPNRGVDETLIALYRRKCLLELNEKVAALFDSGENSDLSEGMSIMNELIIPCMHLMISNDISKEDLDAIEIMRNRWCSYLGQEMDETLQEKLGEFLPRLLDCSAEIIVLKEPPKIRPNSPLDLCSRFAAVMESIHGTSAVAVK